MDIHVKVHTIFMLIGPTECGKTTFAKEVLMPQLKKQISEKNFEANIQYLSSDSIRQEILGFSYDKYHSRMLEVSEQAFDLLFTKLKAVTSFPVSAEFVIIDTTGLSDEFRNRVMNIAKENHYHLDAIIFDYKNTKDFYNSERSKKLIASHANRLRKDVLPTIRKRDFHHIHRIREKNFYNTSSNQRNVNYQIHVTDFDVYSQHILDSPYEYIIIGDVHEKIEELKNLISLYGFQIDNNKMIANEKAGNKRFILIGDWIDKGNNPGDIVRFLYDNQNWFYLVKGNHENFVAKFLQGKIHENEVDEVIKETFFTSIPFFQKDKQLKSDFLQLVDQSKDFYRFIGVNRPSFFVTHAPCNNKYIGKIDAVSLRKQRRFSTIHSEPLEKQLMFIEKEAVGNFPYHIFGHVAVAQPFQIKNKVGIDTGCVHGNKLTAVDFMKGRPFFKSVQTLSQTAEDTKELPNLFSQPTSVRMEELDQQDIDRLNFILKNKVNFISGTMAPSDKDLEKSELESLEKAIRYFQSIGVKKVVLQPKYMGSRCNIYLSNQLNQCYAVSRNGYKITHVDLTKVYQTLQKKFGAYMEENQIQTMILDGELLPWKALGKELIERDFQVVSKAIESELQFLKEHHFDGNFLNLVNHYKDSHYEQLEIKSSKKELINLFGHTTYSTYKNTQQFLNTYQPIETHEKALKVFQEQLRIYANDDNLHYKPFAILKMIQKNGEEMIPTMTTSEMFAFLSEDDFLLLSLAEQDTIEKAESFFNELTTIRKMEGVVIKPEVPVKGAVPFMKVRNEQYLTIVYGYDYQFPHKKEKLIKQKNITPKLRTSIREYELGLEMLSFKQKDISPTNNEYKQVVANLLFETSKEKDFDPRL